MVNPINNIKVYIMIFFMSVQMINVSLAESITVSNNKTHIYDKNGITIVDIATPNKEGVSHNKYNKFNINNNGVVLNNLTADSYSSLSGRLKSNPNLDKNHANIIVNEVIGESVSELAGILEVAGRSAEVIIANPNGITCNGCDFQRGKSVSLATGVPYFDVNGALSSLQINKGTIKIGPKGMDAGKLNYTDILSVNTEINGVIKATNLSLIQGGNSVDYHTGKINPVSAEAKKTSPVVSVNGAGGITAKNIRIVSTSESGNVKLKNIESVSNNIFIAANGDVTLSDKIKSGGNINVIAKNITIDSPAKVHAKDNVTITTASFLNKGNVVSEKDLRIFSGTVINQGDKAYVQSGGNLWIQKNAAGDLSHNVTNESAVLKSERGDLIIKTKRLTNVSNSNPTTSINIKANSTEMNSVGNSLHYLPEWRRHGLLVLYPKLKDFKYEQWFGSLDFLFNDSVNVERQAIRYKDDFKPAYISSGRNSYIVANEFDNRDSFLLTDDNMIITGKNAQFRNHRTGILNLWERYEPEDKNNTRLHFDVEPDTTPPGVIVSNVETGYLLKDKLYTWTDIGGADYSLVSAGNIIFDFKDSVNIQSTVPVVERAINEIHTDSSANHLSADNIIINSNKITINSNIKSGKDLNILAYKGLDANESTLIAGESMSLLADDINLKSTNINTGELSLVSKKGNILYSSGSRPVFTPGISSLPLLYAPKGIYGNSSGDITFNNIALTNTDRVDLSAQGNITIGLDEKSLHGISVRGSDYEISEFSGKFQQWNLNDYLTLNANKKIIINGVSFNSDEDIGFYSGDDITITFDSMWQGESNIYARYLRPKVRINSAKNIIINSGGNIELVNVGLDSSGSSWLFSGKDINLSGVPYSAIKYSSDLHIDNRYVISYISSKKDITIIADKDIALHSSLIMSDGDTHINNGGNVKLTAEKVHYRKRNNESLEDVYQYVSPGIHGKKSLTLLSGGSILFQAAELLSDGVMNISATGGYLYAQAMEETSHYEDKKKKCNRWTLCLTKKEITKIKHEVKNKVTEFTAGDDVNLMARDNITLEATKISTNKNARLTSLSGQIKFKAVNDLLSEQIVSYSKDFYITHRNQYYDDSHWRLPSIHYGGKLSVDAADGITTDSKLLSGSDLKNSVTLLSQQQGLSWLKELTNRDDVQWNTVADAYNRRDIRTRRLNPVASAVLAVVVAAATSGSGLAAWAGNTVSSGVSGAAGAVISGAAHSTMVALTTRAAVALAENQGNLSATFKSLGRSDSVKSMIGQMTVAGLLNGLDVSAGWQNGTPVQSQLPLLSNGDWYKVAQRVAAQSVISSVTDSVLSDTGFNENFKNALLNNIGSQINAEGAKLIGDYGELLTEPGKAIAHSAVSAIRSELTNRSVRGAVTGALAASLAGIVLNDNLNKTAHEQEQQAQIARVMGAVSGLISTGHINGLTTAADTAEIIERYNRQFHLQELNAIDELSDGNLFKKERLLASGCRLINCTAQEFLNSPESLRFNALMDKYSQTYLEDNLLTNYWVTKGNDIVGHYPRFDEKNKIKLFSYTENDKLADSDDFIRNQFSEYITEFTGLSKSTADMVVDSISMSSNMSNGRGKAFKVQQRSNHIRYADLNQVYAIDKSGNKVPMKWFPSGSGINQQGMPFEHYIGTQLPANSKLPDNFKTFDFYDSKNKTAISVKTINTQTDSRLRKPNAIKYTINGHVNDIIKFKEHEKSRMKLTSDIIDKKALYIGLPEKTTKEQWEGINSAIKNANEKNVDIKVTIIKGE
ncbi:DUF637 domain-containing protein [Morganella psychrotolerans]|uniref:endonuclease toxin domain-containing protein n=1 Tax=Morganella psychrotolerans TaxID=368603 RepID=UPI0039B1282D